jgi:hypothetical protein
MTQRIIRGGCRWSQVALLSTRRPNTLAAAGDVLYTAEATGLHILSLADPWAPVELGRLEGFADGRATSLSVIEPWLFVSTSDSLHIYDITTPEQPQKRAVIAMSYAQVTSAGPHFYAVNGIELRLLDLSDPLHPRAAGGFSPAIGTFPYQGPIAAAGNYVYSASNGLFVFQRTLVELPNSVHLPLAARQ